MAVTLTTYNELEKPAAGDLTWDVQMSGNFDKVDALCSAMNVIDGTLATPQAVTIAQARAAILSIEGLLTENIVVSLPRRGVWHVQNNTTGAYTVTLLNATYGADPGYVLDQGASQAIQCGWDVNTRVAIDLTAVELAQLQNIGAVTISNTQWGYLGALDQGVATTDSPTFVALTLSGGSVTGNVDASGWMRGTYLNTTNSSGVGLDMAGGYIDVDDGVDRVTFGISSGAHVGTVGATDFFLRTGSTLRATVTSGGDFTWQNAGAAVGMTWDVSANTNAGGLGIGIAAPIAPLHVVGAAIVTTLLTVGGKNADDATSAGVFTSRGSYAAGIEIKNYDAAGWARFDLNHESASNPILMYQDSSGTAYFRNDSNAATSFDFSLAGVSMLRLLSSGDASFYNAGATVGMTWDASADSNAGGLGIGVAAPPVKLTVNVATAATEALRLTNSADGVRLHAFCGEIQAQNADLTLNAKDGAGIVFKAVNTERASITSSGDFTWRNDGAAVGMTWDASANTNAGGLGIGTGTPTEQLDLSGDAIRIRAAQTPASAAATGDAGMLCWDASYIYVCTATNTWKRAAIATW